MLRNALTEVNKLSYKELDELNTIIEKKLLFELTDTTLVKSINDKKYPVRTVCPHCGSVVIVKYGKYKDKQRYKCMDCNKTFNLFTGTMVANSNVALNVWSKFTKMLLTNKISLRDAAFKLDISLPTAFKMRHKILNKLSMILQTDTLSGKVQIDETFIPESFKGNHTKSKKFKMPRESYHRGGERSFALNDKSCVVTAIDINNNLILKQEGLGKPGTIEINDALINKIEMGSIMITDGLYSYQSLSMALGCQHEVVISSEKINKKGFTLSQINSVHSLLKRWLKLFNGIATKYLNNYLTWFLWLQQNKSLKDIDKYKKLIVNCVAL